MQGKIDSAAGTIWQCLNEHGEITLSKLNRERSCLISCCSRASAG
ncbi:MAG TPA: winged helix-turn-helix domain-containing protein [Candidatus Dormibacteraeota bacterium]|nr:winged helix-turn-helix domain-containing protein [Candidatus Dormibacteraeota bacterium]